MLKELQTAIKTRFNSAAGATLRALVQGLWEEQAPADVILATQTGEALDGSVLPVITFSIITTGLEKNFCADFYTPLVQFTIFGDANNKSSLSLLNIGGELLNLYNGKLLSMDNDYVMIRTDMINQRKLKDDNDMWLVIYDMLYTVQKDITRERIA